MTPPLVAAESSEISYGSGRCVFWAGWGVEMGMLQCVRHFSLAKKTARKGISDDLMGSV